MTDDWAGELRKSGCLKSVVGGRGAIYREEKEDERNWKKNCWLREKEEQMGREIRKWG